MRLDPFPKLRGREVSNPRRRKKPLALRARECDESNDAWRATTLQSFLLSWMHCRKLTPWMRRTGRHDASRRGFCQHDSALLEVVAPMKGCRSRAVPRSRFALGEGAARAGCVQGRQPKWVALLPVVVPRPYRQRLRSGHPDSALLEVVAPMKGCRSRAVPRSRFALGEGAARAGCVQGRQPKWVALLPVVVPRPYRQRLRSGHPDSALLEVVAPMKDCRPRRFGAARFARGGSGGGTRADHASWRPTRARRKRKKRRGKERGKRVEETQRGGLATRNPTLPFVPPGA